MKEFIENVHLKKEDKSIKNDRYMEYLRNQYQSKAFPISILVASFSVFLFYKRSYFQKRLLNNFYALNIFCATQIFVYEIISKFYTEKNKLARIDDIIYYNEKISD